MEAAQEALTDMPPRSEEVSSVLFFLLFVCLLIELDITITLLSVTETTIKNNIEYS